MWGTVILDAYRDSERREMLNALESVFGPSSGTTWATAGIYVYWDPQTRSVLYIGLASDLPVRFGQHNRLRGCPVNSCKKDQIDRHFEEHEFLGLSVLPISSLDQPSTARWDNVIRLEDRDAIEFQQTLTDESMDEIRALEGGLIASYQSRHGNLPPWNKDPGRKPPVQFPEDGTLGMIVGIYDCLLQARVTIRQLAVDGQPPPVYEEHLHGARVLAVSAATFNNGFRNDILRKILGTTFGFPPTAEILDTGYLDARNPLTVGPVLDPPPA